MRRIVFSCLAMVATAIASGSACADPSPNYTLFKPDGVLLRAQDGGTPTGSGYNPETLSRSIQPRSGQSAKATARSGNPHEQSHSGQRKRGRSASSGSAQPYILGPLWNPKSRATAK